MRGGIIVPSLEVFGKEGCSHCDKALEIARRVAADFPLTVSYHDVATRPDLLERYGTEVPVVCLDGEVVFRFKLSEYRLRRLLQGPTAGASAEGGKP